MPPTQFILSGKVAPLPTFEAPLCRFYKVPIPWGGGTQGGPREPKGKPKGTQGTRWDPRGPKGTQGDQGDPRGPKGTQGNPRGPKATQGDSRDRRDRREPKGTQGNPRDGPMGPFGVIPKLFRMEKLFRVEGYYERKPTPKPKKAVRDKIIIPWKHP